VHPRDATTREPTSPQQTAAEPAAAGPAATSGRTPRVLVVVASKHGATAEIAGALARSMAACPAGRAAGLSALAVPVEQRPDPSPFDAVVLGSAVYVGRWLESAREYAAAHAEVLRARPVWLFSSGPIGQPPFSPDEPHDAAPLTALTTARGHRVFPGRLDKARLTFGERAMVTAMRAPIGDFRNWDEVASWAAEIAAIVGVPARAGQP
jgi:menaquinone-dependent protoporphyrinogen IX oxidase